MARQLTSWRTPTNPMQTGSRPSLIMFCCLVRKNVGEQRSLLICLYHVAHKVGASDVRGQRVDIRRSLHQAERLASS